MLPSQRHFARAVALTRLAVVVAGAEWQMKTALRCRNLTAPSVDLLLQNELSSRGCRSLRKGIELLRDLRPRCSGRNAERTIGSFVFGLIVTAHLFLFDLVLVAGAPRIVDDLRQSEVLDDGADRTVGESL